MEITQESKYVPVVDVQSVLLFFALFSPFIGMWVNYYAMWILMFALVLMWIVLTKKEANAGLFFLWGLEFEPAPVDFAFAGAWFKRIISADIKWFYHPSLHLLLAYMFLNLLQIFYSTSIARAAFFAFVTVYTISLAFYFSGYIKSVEIWNEVKKFYLIAVYISAIVLVLMILLIFVQGRVGRPAGFFKDPNVAGAFITTGALYAMSRILFGKKEEILKFTLLFLFLFLSIVLTFSRGSLLNLISGILFLGFISIITKRSKRFFVVLSVAFLIAIVSVPVILEVFRQSFRFRGAQWYDIYGRAMAWRAGIELFKSYPLGIGPGQFENYSLDYQKSMGGWMLRLTPSAHNFYLRVLTENGSIGFLTIILALIFVILTSLKFLFKANKDEKFFVFADLVWILSSILGILVQSFVIDTLHWRHFWILIGFLFGILNLCEFKNKN